MAIDVTNANEIFEGLGYEKTSQSVWLQATQEPSLKLWALITHDTMGSILSLGAISPTVNRLAFKWLKKSSNNTIKPQFPAIIGPPIFVSVQEEISINDTDFDLRRVLDSFDEKFAKHSIEDWFNLSLSLTPYTHTSQIIIPAYFLLYSQMKDLQVYIDAAISAGVSDHTKRYYLEILKEVK